MKDDFEFSLLSECECNDYDDKCADDITQEMRYYRDNAVQAYARLMLPNTVWGAIIANPYRSAVVISNLGPDSNVILIRVHPTNLDPTLPGITGIVGILEFNKSLYLYHSCVRRIIQGNICIVAPSSNSSSVGVSVTEVVQRPGSPTCI